MTKRAVFAIVLTCGLLSLPSRAAQGPAAELVDKAIGTTRTAHATVDAATGETVGISRPAGSGLSRLLPATGSPAAKVNQLTAVLYDAWWENLVDNDGDGFASLGDLMWDADVTGGSGSLSVEYDIFNRPAGGRDWVILATVGPHTITDASPDDAYGLTINGDGPAAMYEYAVGVAQAGAGEFDDVLYPTDDEDLGPVGIEGAEHDGGGAGGSNTLWVAVGASTAGIGGTFWRTDLGVLNRGSGAANITITVHASSGPVSATEQIADRGQAIYYDILGQLGLSKGSIEVTSDRPISVTSRTYNDMGAAGTAGQFLDGLTPSQGALAGQTFVLMHLVADSGWRTNLGFQNMGTTQGQLSVTYFDSDGNQIGGAVAVSVAPSRVDDSTARFPSGNIGYAVVRVTAGSGIQGYASVIDPITGDATTIPMKF